MKKKKNNMVDWKVLIAVAICITIMECAALYKGINGTMFSIVMIIMGGIAGITIPSPFTKK